MKIYHFVPVALLLCVFTFTNVASAYSAPSLAALSTQLQGLLLQLHALLGQSAPLTASTTVTPITPRTCQVNIYTRVNGIEKYATTTMTGALTDQFAIGLSIGTNTKDIPYTERMQSVTWGKGSTTATAGYFTPQEYAQSKAGLAVFVGDSHYKIVGVNLDNVNNPNSGTTFSSSTPYAEALITNSAIDEAPTGKVTVRANVSNCTAAVLPPPVQDPNKPNFLFLLTDDLDMQTMSQLPKLKALMTDKGMTFENHFTSISQCCPARTSVLCGEYGHNTGVLTNDDTNADGTPGALTAFKQFGNEKNTIAVWLKNAGYRTALMGKYLNGYEISRPGMSYAVPEGWTDWAVPLEGDVYAQYNYTLNVNGAPEKHNLPNCTGDKANAPACREFGTSSLVSTADKQANFMINVLNKKAKDFISTSAKTATPFFLYLSPMTPHSPSTPSPKYEALLDNEAWKAKHPLPKTASFNEVDISDKPTWLKNNAGLLGVGDIDRLQKAYQKRVVSMYAIEDMLSELIDTLEKNGQLDNTYIVFMSDNGFHLGQHRLSAGKVTEFDTDLRIPLIIRGPKVAAGSKTTQLTGIVDVAPTLVSLANLPIPTTVDGRSLKDTLLGGTSVPRNAFLIEHANPADPKTLQSNKSLVNEPRETVNQNDPVQGVEFVSEYRGIRTKQYTYVHYTKNDEEELYDNVNDPEQLNNVANLAGVGLLNVLRKWTADLAACKGAACRRIEAENRLDGVGGALDGKACFYGGKQINNGASRVFYKSRTVETGLSCEAIKQTRKCTDGVLDGDASYNVTTCSMLERFNGINLNRVPENVDLALMNRAGAKWMRANADILTYFRATTSKNTAVGLDQFIAQHNQNQKTPPTFSNWDQFVAIANSPTADKKGMINIMWDFSQYNLRIPTASSTQEKALFDYLDLMLEKLLPAADIIVAGNEPFINTLAEDWVYDPILKSSPIATFYKRVAEHLDAYMRAKGVRNQHKLYMGAFTNVDGSAMQKEWSVNDLLAFANTTDYIDGVDIHTHVKTMDEMRQGFKFISQRVQKPITDTEYTYVFTQALHLQDLLTENDIRPFNGMSFLEKYANATATKTYKGTKWINESPIPFTFRAGQRKYTATTTVNDYMAMAVYEPVPQAEWNDFFKSRSWTIDNYIKKSNKIFSDYNVNGVTFGLMLGALGDVNLRNGTPWYMNGLYSPGLVQLIEGKPTGNYQYLMDFQELNGLPKNN